MTSVSGGTGVIAYRRGVLGRLRAMFAGSGIHLPDVRVTLLVIVVAFGAGVGAGWITAAAPSLVSAAEDPVSIASPGPEKNPDVEVALPTLTTIERDITAEDNAAGVLTADYVIEGQGTFTVVPGADEPDPLGGPVRWVSVAVEDGVEALPYEFKDFVLDTLNDERGWGTEEALQFVATDGVADYRVLLASPYTTALLCPDPHRAVTVGPVVGGDVPSPSPEPSPEASPSASASPADEVPEEIRYCVEDGAIVVSIYDWTAGYAAFGEDYNGARRYLLNHRLGHLLGREETECVEGRADVMDAQREELAEACEPNPWPYPDADTGEEPTTPTAMPTADPDA